MKKYTQLLVVLVLVLTVVGVARNSPAWASSLLASEQPSGALQSLAGIAINETGSYYIGGLCVFNVVYTHSGASATVAVDVPAEISRKVPFSYEDDLYLAGCHVVHYTMDRVTREMSAAYGSWEVCFGDRPDEQLTIYYYLDNPDTGSAVWLPLITTVKDGFVCAPANYTGVYAPGSKHITALVPITGNGDQSNSGTGNGTRRQQPPDTRGTVRPPSPTTIIEYPIPITGTGGITQSGTYHIGGICSIIVDYYVPGLSDNVHVEEDIEISSNVPFPDNEGLLYLPGCHVFHYKDAKLVKDVTPAEGSWKICFAAVPNKKTTIYFYYAKDDLPESAIPGWAPLETTIESGMACAPLTDHTGVYAPAGK